MNKKRIFLLSDDIYLFSGLKAFFPNLLLVDINTYVADAHLTDPHYSSSVLIIDNRVPYMLARKWKQKNSSQFINVKIIVIRMSENKCFNRGYEYHDFISATEQIHITLAILKKEILNRISAPFLTESGNLWSFHLSDFEQEMLGACITQEGQDEFCQANSLTVRALYRYRDKITHRLGFNYFNESLIFLLRNQLLDKVVFFSERRDRQSSMNSFYNSVEANRLSLAIKNNEIIPYYQPILGKEGNLCGVEVLARWPLGHNYAISQREFIPLAESSGLINELTSYLMSTVARDLSRTAFQHPLFVAFNVSPSSLSNPVFYWECLNFLELTHALPVQLMVEITENQMLTITPALKELVCALRNRGVLFALDDFGTGYANLCYLSELELDVIKIDKMFINTIEAVGNTQPMLESIIHMVKILGLKAVAEGVEYDYQHQWLKNHQVDYLQGYYYLPPATWEDFSRFMARQHSSSHPAAEAFCNKVALKR